MYRIGYRQVQSRNLTQKTEELQEELEKDFFTNLVRINFKYLDKYYLQTQEQGDKSFLLSAAAAVAGLSIIVAGITLMFFDKAQPAYLTTAAGVLSEFNRSSILLSLQQDNTQHEPISSEARDYAKHCARLEDHW